MSLSTPMTFNENTPQFPNLCNKNCWKFGHSFFVCRSNLATCGKCGENECEGDCENDPECLLCEGYHASCEVNCPKRGRKAEIIRVRSNQET